MSTFVVVDELWQLEALQNEARRQWVQEDPRRGGEILNVLSMEIVIASLGPQGWKEPQGFAILLSCRNYVSILAMYVGQDHRRKGCGRGLIELTQTLAYQYGTSQLECIGITSNYEGFWFWYDMGFHQQIGGAYDDYNAKEHMKFYLANDRSTTAWDQWKQTPAGKEHGVALARDK